MGCGHVGSLVPVEGRQPYLGLVKGPLARPSSLGASGVVWGWGEHLCPLQGGVFIIQLLCRLAASQDWCKVGEMVACAREPGFQPGICPRDRCQ